FPAIRFPGLLRRSIRPIARDQAAHAIRVVTIPIATLRALSECHHRNRLSMEQDADTGAVRAKARRKIAGFAIDRAVPCKTRSKDRCGRRTECERKDDEPDLL